MTNKPSVAVIGAGPAGLMAAEVLSRNNYLVDVYDSLPSAGRKFLMAGKGGMNITHSEPLELFLSRYGNRRLELEAILRDFSPGALRAWTKDLGIDTFVGSSGRVFPVEMKAAPLLRAWLHRLRTQGVRFHMRHRWLGWSDKALRFETNHGARLIVADAVVLALGGGSWPQLGSDGAWQHWLSEQQIEIEPLKPSNCGFDIAWSDYFRNRFAGQPIKPVTVELTRQRDTVVRRQGELMISEYGLEGGLIYALSAPLRDEIAEKGAASITLDLLPNLTLPDIEQRLSAPRGKRSLSTHLRKTLNIDATKIALLREALPSDELNDTQKLAASLKALTLKLLSPRPLAEAISSAGGVSFDELDRGLMLRKLPGIFCAGEMLEWEAPTGGYLLTACLATGHAAGKAATSWLQHQKDE